MKKYQVKVKDIIPETEDAISIVFEHPENEKIQFKPGQFLTLHFDLGGEKIRRAYSLSSSPFTDEDLRVAVKRVKDGKISNLLNNILRPGDFLEILEPMGLFTLDLQPENQFHYVLWAGGSGITPLYSMLKSILHQEPNSQVTLVYANRDEHSIIFKNELEHLLIKYADRLKIIHILSQPAENWPGYRGRLTQQTAQQILQEIHAEKAISQWMCGPAGMMDIISEASKALGLPLPKKESFGNSIEESAGLPSSFTSSDVLVEREVEVEYDGQHYKFSVKPSQTILEAAMENDIDLPYSCMSGLCTACMGKCTSGKIKMDEDDCLTDEEMAQGFVLTCVAHPLTEDVVIVID